MCYKHKFLVKLFPEDIKVKGVNMWWRYGSFKFRISKMEFKWCFWGVEFLDLGPVIDKTENPQPCIKQPDLLKWCYINMSLFVAGKRDPLLARLVLGEAKTVHKKIIVWLPNAGVEHYVNWSDVTMAVHDVYMFLLLHSSKQEVQQALSGRDLAMI